MKGLSKMNWNERLHKTMPHGSSTTSKNPSFLPEEPQIITRGRGCRVYNQDGREFIDFRNSLGPVTLGYCFPEIDEAIRAQLENGIVYGHPTALECEVSEKLCEIIPAADQVRFLKTGGESCAAAIYIARAFTGRDHIIQIGYNGWLNTLAIGATVLPSAANMTQQKPGVPACVSALYHAVKWNEEDKIRELFTELDGKIAAVIVSADYENFEAGKTFYPFLREITKKNGSLLIFDEIVTGFRVAMGGVSEYYGVTPDLVVFAKGIANGMPLSLYAGSREVMAMCEKPGFSISSTYGGETLSLAACRAAIEVYKRENVVDHIWKQGEYMWGQFNSIMESEGAPIRMKGIGPCPRLVCSEGNEILGRFMRRAYANGVSLYYTSYVNFSHKKADLDEALEKLTRAAKEI